MIANLFKMYLLVTECTVWVTHVKPESRWLCLMVYPVLGDIAVCSPLDQQQTVGDFPGSSQL